MQAVSLLFIIFSIIDFGIANQDGSAEDNARAEKGFENGPPPPVGGKVELEDCKISDSKSEKPYCDCVANCTSGDYDCKAKCIEDLMRVHRHPNGPSLPNGNDYSNDDYQYKEESEIDSEEEGKDDGDRLVGGKISNTRTFPFVVGWNLFGNPDHMSCSGSLITPTYILSAAHCNNIIIMNKDKDKIDEYREDCVKETEENGFFKVIDATHEYQLKCRYMKKTDAIEIILEPPGKAWIGVNNINQESVNPERKEANIKRHIRHLKAYRGGATYGPFGGHDITLLELDKTIFGFKTACLPSPTYDDIRQGQDDTILAGYGSYHRSGGNTCQTNRYGPMKFHYCDKTYGVGQDACITKEAPPQSKECDSFFENLETPDTVPSDKEEIVIKREGKRSVMCHPKHNLENEDYGWCHTKGNYYEVGKEDENKTKSWGFCGKDCYLDTDAPDKGILRMKEHIHILSDQLCEKFLNISLEIKPEVMPRILCVAQQHHWKEEVYKKEEDTETGTVRYRKVSSKKRRRKRYGSTSYVASVGTCKGDSGGPSFVEESKGRYVVTGIVSGGRGALGECGGISNPVHYVRVKRFGRWIVENIESKARKQICWNQAFQDRQGSGKDYNVEVVRLMGREG